MAEEKKKAVKERFEVTEIATQTAPVIKDNETDDILTPENSLCKILNEVTEIRKLLKG